MIFVVAFDRTTSELLTFESFADETRTEAESLYRSLLAGTMFDLAPEVEVNMFESESEHAFHKTHARYFQTVKQTLDDIRRALVA